MGEDDSCSGGLLQLLDFAEVEGRFHRARTVDDVLAAIRALSPDGVLVDMNAADWTDPVRLAERLACPVFVLHPGHDTGLPARLHAAGVRFCFSADDAFEAIFEPLEAFVAAVRARGGASGLGAPPA